MSTDPRTIRIFLSHSGLDAERARRLAAALKRELYQMSGGLETEVFNTSEPEHRYQDLKDRLKAGDVWLAEIEKYEEELRAYLSRQLLDSSAYILLVTPKSLAADSEWIRFDIETARSHAASARRRFFLPCVMGGAPLGDLPEGANQFQGAELSEAGGIIESEGMWDLARAVLDIVLEGRGAGPRLTLSPPSGA
jgi:hypothetical protein